MIRRAPLFAAWPALLLLAPACKSSESKRAPTTPDATVSATRSTPTDTPQGSSLGAPTADVSDADRVAVARGEEAFATRLYAKLAKGGHENLFFSPTSIRMALAMTWAGARGETARQMASALALDGDGPSIHRGFAAELRDLASASTIEPPGDASAYQREETERRRQTVRVVNRLWGQKGRAFRSDYLALLSGDYAAPLEQLDFEHAPEAARTNINTFVDGATEHRIQNLVPVGAVTDQTKLVLTNAVYFKATWDERFYEDATQEGDFHVTDAKTVRAPLMSTTRELRYAKVDGAQLVELPYASKRMVMVVALPAAGTLSKLERSMSDATLPSWVGALQSTRVKVTLPRFKTTSDFSLAAALSAMGMRTAFASKQADFSGIDGTKELFLSDVIHKAFVAVDEKGTEAAAATAALMKAGAARVGEPVEFRADHPFLFFIRDTTSGAVLFMGRIEDPTS